MRRKINEDREFAKRYNREQKRKDEFLNRIGNKINKIFYTIDIKKEVLYEILTGKLYIKMMSNCKFSRKIRERRRTSLFYYIIE